MTRATLLLFIVATATAACGSGPVREQLSDDSQRHGPTTTDRSEGTAGPPLASPGPGIDPSQRGHGVVGPEAVRAFDSLSEDDKSLIRRARVLFGHQSVGGNLLDGAKTLGFPFKTVADSLDLATPVLGEASVEENHDPHRKVRSFAALVQGKALGEKLDVAGFKLCWVDFYEPDKLLGLREAYAKQIDVVRAKYPNMRLFHVTPPLATKEPAENAVRADFGGWLKKTYAERDVVFDLAAIESTDTNGDACKSGSVRALCASYAADDGHLNAGGSALVAKAFIVALAKSLGR